MWLLRLVSGGCGMTGCALQECKAVKGRPNRAIQYDKLKVAPHPPLTNLLPLRAG